MVTVTCCGRETVPSYGTEALTSSTVETVLDLLTSTVQIALMEVPSTVPSTVKEPSCA